MAKAALICYHTFRMVHTMRVKRRILFVVIGVNDWCILRLNHIQYGERHQLAIVVYENVIKKRENRIFINNSVKEREISSFFVVFLVDCERGERKRSQNYKFELIIRLRNKWRYPNKSYLDISSFIPCLAITTENKWIFALNGERNGKIKDEKNTILQIKQCKTANVCRKKINYI